MTNSPIKVTGSRLWQSLMDLAKVGATPLGGNCRLALTDEDKAGRDLVISWFRDEGMSIRIDQIGNIFARREGRQTDLAPVMCGSHIDTQPTGGRFDGNYGVLAGLEVIRTLNEHKIETDHPIDVAIWTNEEGSRFVPVMMGSGVFSNTLTLEEALSAQDKAGISVRDELKRIGYAGTETVGGYDVKAYFEAHIEQGPVLDTENLPVGVVSGALGLYWYDVIVTGQECHAGPSPMSYRRDALKTSSQLINRILTIADSRQPDGRVTVGELDMHPNSRNVVPGRVKFSVDLRHSDKAELDKMHDEFTALLQAEKKEGIEIELKVVQKMPPTHFNKDCINRVRDAVNALKLPHIEMISGAGHDAVYLSRTIPTAMIFVPCIGGISHNEIEDARPDELEAGAHVLLNAMLAEAGSTL
ncbi:Zn-dependent hydrolase [Marinomonas pollencensis]|uniref:N-carbamoyl-L-amino-acid hydrolase n=1 Tax=Marinomonas pollencensis TaxID=491954 RepID=A0A3E0DKM6_9GAMM|nr:Zn-dependent hydrolase [Marinomonas pollencensis]REG83189.1 N-carbamoyl-L-amino-acid hydrolase [Marinomonas pollencensis]